MKRTLEKTGKLWLENRSLVFNLMILDDTYKRAYKVLLLTLQKLVKGGGCDFITRNMREIWEYYPMSWSEKDMFNSLRPTQICCHFEEGIFKCIFFNEKVWISLKISQIYSLGLKKQYSSTGSDNGLVPTRRQAIIWTND